MSRQRLLVPLVDEEEPEDLPRAPEHVSDRTLRNDVYLRGVRVESRRHVTALQKREIWFG